MNRTLTQLYRSRAPLAGVAIFALVSIVLTSLVAGTLLKGGTKSSIELSAMFRDATGLKTGDDVRIAGVRVGKVTGIRLDGDNALVRFIVDEKQPVYDRTIAKIDYQNLMGQRYVALTNPNGTGNALRDGGSIPLSRTQQGLDLNALFNAFKPLFELIKPDDVNLLATNLVQVLQGEGGALQHLTDQTVRITSTLTDRDDVIGAVIQNVGAVMGTLDEHHTEISALVGQLDSLTSTIAANKDQVGATLDSVSGLVSTFSGVLTDLEPTVNADVRALGSWATSFARQTPRLAGALTDVQLLLRTYVKTLGLGSFLNTYVCKSNLQLGAKGPVVPLGPSGKTSRRCQ